MREDIEDTGYDSRTSQKESGNKRRLIKYSNDVRWVTTIKLPFTASIMINTQDMNEISV